MKANMKAARKMFAGFRFLATKDADAEELAFAHAQQLDDGIDISGEGHPPEHSVTC